MPLQSTTLTPTVRKMNFSVVWGLEAFDSTPIAYETTVVGSIAQLKESGSIKIKTSK
ncbi:hypothetical protein M8C21_007468, partial [Ambrosia artemisiifolia]